MCALRRGLARAALTALAGLAGLGCAGRAPGGVAPPPGAPPTSSAGLSVIERAEPGPITALAFVAPHLFAGGAQGLRRIDVKFDEWESIGADEGLPGRAVSALGADAEGGIWVATDAGVGRLVRVPASGGAAPEGASAAGGDGDELRYESAGAPLAHVTWLAPLARANDGAWAAGPDGLYRLNGHAAAPIEALRGVPVTSLDLDPDGRAVWVGTRGRGLFRVAAQVAPVLRGDDPALTRAEEPGVESEVIGTAITAAGTRLVAARAGRGGRLVVLSPDNALVESYRAQPDLPVLRLGDGGGDAVLIAGAPGAERAFHLHPLARGELVPPGGLRLVPSRHPAGARWVGVPLPGQLPPQPTVVAAGGGALYFGTARMGVARAEPARARYFGGTALVGDADRLTVACATPARCYVVTQGPRAWISDGDSYTESYVGEPPDGQALAVAADPQADALYALSTPAKARELIVSRLPNAGARAGESRAASGGWEPVMRVPLDIAEGSRPVISFAALSPQKTLWAGLRLRRSDGEGETTPEGTVEIDLAAKTAVVHRPPRPKEPADPSRLPLPANVTGVLFDGPATWFASSSGVWRFQEGQLRSWGEDDGMESEVVHGVAKGADGAVWAATSAGVARFDGKQWRPVGGRGAPAGDVPGENAARALVNQNGRLWAATASGLRVVRADAPPRGLPEPRDATDLRAAALDADVRDAVLDRFGRIWALARASILFVEARPAFVPANRAAQNSTPATGGTP
jgi:hypothetical protein